MGRRASAASLADPGLLVSRLERRRRLGLDRGPDRGRLARRASSSPSSIRRSSSTSRRTGRRSAQRRPDPEIEWPATDLIAASAPAAERDLVLLDGTEPNLRWRTFAETFTAAAERLGVEMVVTLGALIAEVSHTLPVPITGLARMRSWSSGSTSAAPTTRARPGSSASSTTIAPGGDALRLALGRRPPLRRRRPQPEGGARAAAAARGADRDRGRRLGARGGDLEPTRSRSTGRSPPSPRSRAWSSASPTSRPSSSPRTPGPSLRRDPGPRLPALPAPTGRRRQLALWPRSPPPGRSAGSRTRSRPRRGLGSKSWLRMPARRPRAPCARPARPLPRSPDRDPLVVEHVVVAAGGASSSQARAPRAGRARAAGRSASSSGSGAGRSCSRSARSRRRAAGRRGRPCRAGDGAPILKSKPRSIQTGSARRGGLPVAAQCRVGAVAVLELLVGGPEAAVARPPRTAASAAAAPVGPPRRPVAHLSGGSAREPGGSRSRSAG